MLLSECSEMREEGGENALPADGLVVLRDGMGLREGCCSGDEEVLGAAEGGADEWEEGKG